MYVLKKKCNFPQLKKETKYFSNGDWCFLIKQKTKNAEKTNLRKKLKYKKFKTNMFSVSKYGIGVYENFQSDMYDVANWSLEWLFTIFSANVTRFSLKLMGIH